VSNQVLDKLFEDLEHPNPYIQTQAFTAMAEHWQQEATPRLIALLSQPNVGLRRASVRALGSFGEAAMQPIADCFRTTDDATVRASLELPGTPVQRGGDGGAERRPRR
jgi:bilin biosynthesis protein